MKKRLISIVLTLSLMLSFMPIVTQTANAVSGPRPSKEAGIAIGFTHFGDSEILYQGSDKKKSAYFEGFKYNKKTNTLTLDNIGTSEEYYLSVYDMGDDFKINVKGKNSLGFIEAYSNVKDRMNLTITGTGTLTINRFGGFGAAIHGYANGKSNTKITIDNTVNLTLYGGYNEFEGKNEKVIEVTGAKSGKQSNVFRIGGKKTGSTKVSKSKARKGYDYKYGDEKLVIKKSGKSFLKNSSSSSTSAKKTGAKQYTVKYNLNGGKGKISAQKKTKGRTLSLSKKKPTRAGYRFVGWSVKKNGKVSYKAGGSYKTNKSITLYAKWKKIQPKVYVLIYGAAKGQNPSSTNNVSMMYRALKQLEVPGYDTYKKNVVKIEKKSFKKSEFKDAIKSTFKNAKKDDLCFVYLNTHSKGVIDTRQKIRDYKTGELKPKINYYGLSTGNGAKDYYSWKDVLSYMGNNIKGDIIFMPEVCNSGKFISYVDSAGVSSRMAILAAADSDQGARQIELWFFGGGNYTRALSSGLGFKWNSPIVNRLAADKNKNGKVTLKELYKYITEFGDIAKSGQSPQMYAPRYMESLVLYKK